MPRRCRVAQVGVFEMVKTAPSKHEPEAQAAVERVFANTGLRFNSSTFPPGNSSVTSDLCCLDGLHLVVQPADPAVSHGGSDHAPRLAGATQFGGSLQLRRWAASC